MARDFNIKFNNVNMIDDANNILENTKVTKVTLIGNNQFKSLDSAFKDCTELMEIEGELELNEVDDIDNLLDGSTLVDDITLKNVNDENISSTNALKNVSFITFTGDTYEKDALQNIIKSQEWNYDGFLYREAVEENVFVIIKEIEGSDRIEVQDTLEQKTIAVDIKGETYQNLIQGSGEYVLTDEGVTFQLLNLRPNTDYTIQLNFVDNNINKIVAINLGGNEISRRFLNDTEICHSITMRTSNTIFFNELRLSGVGETISNVMLFEGIANQQLDYFDGIQSVGELQENGEYRIDIISSVGDGMRFGKRGRL